MDPTEWVVPGARVLEVGSGDGTLARRLARQGAVTVALDLAGEALRRVTGDSDGPQLRSTGRLWGLQGRAECIPLRAGAFDLVLVQTSLMHIDLEPFAFEARRLLRPGGRLVLVEPMPYHPLVALYRALWSAGRGSGARYPSRRDLSRLLQGFTSIRISRHGFLSPFGAWFGARAVVWIVRWDRWLLARVPALRRLAWFSYVVAER